MGLVIGLSGKKRAGKDTFAFYLRTLDPAFGRLALADELKREIERTFAPSGGCMSMDMLKQSGDPVVSACLRSLMQQWGALRRRQNPNYFLDKLKPRFEDRWPYIVTDIRHRNEADFIAQLPNSILVRIESERTIQDTHESETELDSYPFTYTLHNNGTRDDFKRTVERFYYATIAPRLHGN